MVGMKITTKQKRLYNVMYGVHICFLVGFVLAIVALVSGQFWLSNEQFSRVAMISLIYITVFLLRYVIIFGGGKE